MKSLLGKVDAAIHRAERITVGVLTLVMSLVVFADVVHRVFSRSPGRLASLLAGWMDAPDLAARLDEVLAPAVIVLSTLGVAYFALRTRSPSDSRARALGLAVAGTAAATAVVQGFVRFLPEGIIWAPYFSLSVFLWVGLIGASMATYTAKHLALEMGEKLWPVKARPYVARVAQMVAGAFALMIAVLGARSVSDHFAQWSETPESALIPSVDIPKWIVFLVVPYAFGMIAARFIGRALGLLAPPPTPGDEVPR